MKTNVLGASTLFIFLIGLGQAFAQTKFMTEDVDRFFLAIEKAETSKDPVKVIQREYLEAGTPGLKFYDSSGRINDAREIWRTYEANRGRYPAIRAFYERLPAAFEKLSSAYSFFDSLYPGIETPPVYFIIGHFQGGATAFDGGLVIALDNWATPWWNYDPEKPLANLYDPAEVLHQIVTHELVHFHQKCDENCGSLLAEALMEGSADFIAWLIMGERANQYMTHIYDYFDRNEAEVWQKFKVDMEGEDRGVWLYNNEVEGMPENLGYAIGFHIAKAYYEKTPDKNQAVKDILGITDAGVFLEASGYPEKFK